MSTLSQHVKIYSRNVWVSVIQCFFVNVVFRKHCRWVFSFCYPVYMTHIQEPYKGDTKIWNVYIYRCFATDALDLIAQQWRNWWLYSPIKTYCDLVWDPCRSRTTQKYFEISTATSSLYVLTHYTAAVVYSFGYISTGITIRYELPTVKVFYDKFINLSAVTGSSYDPIILVLINLSWVIYWDTSTG